MPLFILHLISLKNKEGNRQGVDTQEQKQTQINRNKEMENNAQINIQNGQRKTEER